MDFTGAVGRIVDDPKEAKAIAIAEGYSWKRRFRGNGSTGGGGGGVTGSGSGRLHPESRQSIPVAMIIESGVHCTQPWFHSGMTRDQATTLVNRHGTVDGVFLVRQSRSNPGAFVLTYKCGGKVLHAQIIPVLDPVRDAHVFSLDSGVTKFYDLLQLVEFYQLNAGCLPTRLTHYVVQSSVAQSSSPSASAAKINNGVSSNPNMENHCGGISVCNNQNFYHHHHSPQRSPQQQQQQQMPQANGNGVAPSNCL